MMLGQPAFSALIGLLGCSIRARAIDAVRNPVLDTDLANAPTVLERINILTNRTRAWLFDFHAQPSYSFAPGSVVNANAATFPATIGNELTMAMIQLGPCAMLPPHYHPRGSNYVVAIKGNTTTYMIQENGAPLVTEFLTPGKMTIFPRASLHAMQNMGCGESQLVSALSSTDTGTHNFLNGLFQMPEVVVNAAFGSPEGGAMQWAGVVPAVGYGAMRGDAECLARCASMNKDGKQ